MMRSMLCGLLLNIFTTFLNGYEMVVRSPQGDIQMVQVAADQNVETFIESLRSKYNTDEEFLLDFKTATPAPKEATTKNNETGRNYFAALTSNEKNDIRYIVNTLGMASLTKIAKEKSSLKKAGSRINHVHPFRFLSTVFTNEELKVSMHAVRDRGWIWGDFFDGLKESLNEEMKRGNLLQFTHDFANNVRIDLSVIYQSVSDSDWKQFIDILIDKIPREGNVDRYNM